MVVGLPNVARSPHDLESGVGTHVCRPFVPSTPNQEFLGDCEESWGIRESTRVVQQTMATDIPACEAHTAVYTFGPDIVCWLTSNANGCLMTMYVPLRVTPHTWPLYFPSVYSSTQQRLKQQIMAYHRIGHKCRHVVAEYIPVYKIEHSPTPSKVHKPPHQSIKVWLCLPPGPLRHHPPAVNPHPPGSAPRQPRSAISWAHVGAPSARPHPWLPARPLPLLFRCSLHLVVYECFGHGRNLAERFISPQWCGLYIATRVWVIPRFFIRGVGQLINLLTRRWRGCRPHKLLLQSTRVSANKHRCLVLYCGPHTRLRELLCSI